MSPAEDDPPRDAEGAAGDAAPTSPPALARAYYAAIDAGAYDDLAALLAPGFVHDRPDRTIEGREEFVRFMREERPLTRTTHDLAGVYRNGASTAVRGRLHDADGAELFEFLDVFTVEDGRVTRLRTHTALDRSSP